MLNAQAVQMNHEAYVASVMLNLFGVHTSACMLGDSVIDPDCTHKMRGFALSDASNAPIAALKFEVCQR